MKLEMCLANFYIGGSTIDCVFMFFYSINDTIMAMSNTRTRIIYP